MTERARYIKISILAGVVIILFSGSVHASGFRIIDQSATATGQADVFAAQADTPAAIYYNPAGLTQLSGIQVEAGINMFALRTEHTATDGTREDMKKKEHFPIFGYVSSDLGSEKWRVGLGVFSPFGLSTDWSDTGFSRYVATHTEMETININPTIAFQVLPELSLAVGLDYLYSEMELEKQLNFGALMGQPGNIALDGNFKADGDGDGWGYNLGLLFTPAPQHSIGVSFRSQINVSFDGNATITNPDKSQIKSGASTDISFPPNILVGYAFRPGKQWKIEFDVDWTGWSTYKTLTMDFDTLPDETIENDWHDAFTYALGAEYYPAADWTVRAGVGYMETPIPERTFNTTLPRVDQYAFSLGLGYKKDWGRIDLAYLWAVGKEDIQNDVGADVGADLDGEYKNSNHVVALSCLVAL